MSPKDFADFHKMLENERSFDELFSDVHRSDDFTLYYNKYFSDDPIFNHAVISEEILDSENPSEDRILNVLQSIKSDAKVEQIPASIFVDEFRRNAAKFEKVAVEFGFRIIEKMDIMSKAVNISAESPNDQILVEETKDVETWNETFVSSFGIQDSWRIELQRRGKVFASNPSTILLLARENGASIEISGCSLLHFSPPEYAGVYCVGTVPERRFRGVAKELMLKAESIAYEKKCNLLLLQTMTSDGVTPMYLRLGYRIDFERVVLQLSQ